jgi:hypothetical protein
MTLGQDSNPEFLENYVMSNVDLETLERWTIRCQCYKTFYGRKKRLFQIS